MRNQLKNNYHYVPFATPNTSLTLSNQLNINSAAKLWFPYYATLACSMQMEDPAKDKNLEA